MAEGEAPRRSSGLNWRSPGWKEYAIVFVGALAGLYLYNKFRGGGTAAQESAPAGSSGGGTTPTGLSLASFMLWVQDHASSPGVYFHAHPKHGEPYFSQGGHHVSEPSGQYEIGGKEYYLHADPKGGKQPYFTLNGKRVTPPSGAVS